MNENDRLFAGGILSVTAILRSRGTCSNVLRLRPASLAADQSVILAASKSRQVNSTKVSPSVKDTHEFRPAGRRCMHSQSRFLETRVRLLRWPLISSIIVRRLFRERSQLLRTFSATATRKRLRRAVTASKFSNCRIVGDDDSSRPLEQPDWDRTESQEEPRIRPHERFPARRHSIEGNIPWDASREDIHGRSPLR